jgi:Fe-S-cluster containining protein
MPGTTNLALTDSLPLTCTRSGTCCHGKMVWLNPWELARMAAAKGLTPRIFRDRHCEFGGIRLRFDSPPGWNGLAACSQYLPGRGCSVHAGRPLVCRLYPLGLKRHGKELLYIHQGSSFPCLEGCPQVLDLPHLTVADYLAGQDVTASVAAQDVYLELMQRLADGAFVLLLETGLAASGDRLTLRLWRELGEDHPEHLAKRLGPEWIDRLMLPDLGDGLDDPAAFCRRHHDMLRSQAQTSFGTLTDAAALREASGLMMGLALHLGRGLGANPVDLAGHWIVTAKKLGALDDKVRR